MQEKEITGKQAETSLLALKPGIVVAKERIADLLSVIGNSLDGCEPTRELISGLKLLSVELNEQLDLIDTLVIYQ